MPPPSAKPAESTDPRLDDVVEHEKFNHLVNHLSTKINELRVVGYIFPNLWVFEGAELGNDTLIF